MKEMLEQVGCAGSINVFINLQVYNTASFLQYMFYIGIGSATFATSAPSDGRGLCS